MSQQEVKRGVQVIQIIKSGPTFNLSCQGNLTVSDVIAALEMLKYQLLKQNQRDTNPALDLKVRQMP